MKLDHFLMFYLKFMSWTSWSSLQVVKMKQKIYLSEIYLVSDILTNFHEDPIIRSTKKLPITDTCN